MNQKNNDSNILYETFYYKEVCLKCNYDISYICPNCEGKKIKVEWGSKETKPELKNKREYFPFEHTSGIITEHICEKCMCNLFLVCLKCNGYI